MMRREESVEAEGRRSYIQETMDAQVILSSVHVPTDDAGTSNNASKGSCVASFNNDHRDTRVGSCTASAEALGVGEEHLPQTSAARHPSSFPILPTTPIAPHRMLG